MEELNRIREMMMRDLKEYAHKNELTAAARGDIHMITDTIKNIYKIEMFEELGESGDSYEPGESYATGSGRNYVKAHYSRGGMDRRGGAYDGKASYARNRGTYGGENQYGGGYSSRRNSYDARAEEVSEMLMEAMESATDPIAKEKIRECMEYVKR